ncbi:hypothetical protein [Alicyclobacillus fastidiosus]|uniref:hypothetical protein n=1 Tax=Alicyclobacillus fastidiosus TaxID=392011 RepID=UPI0023E99D27|nr:hypothetical protein [Alicyclobacillus fastidiosus]GMA61449.1 hypothetical protein GCM10025859_18890 [Alicyclobacillus fastidiosus]
MAWGEAKAWNQGDKSLAFYQDTLTDAVEKPIRDKGRKKIVKPSEMPWELAPQGILKHMINPQMNTRMETVDAYMQIIPLVVGPASIGIWQKSVYTSWRGEDTICIRTAMSRSPIRIIGYHRLKSSGSSGSRGT